MGKPNTTTEGRDYGKRLYVSRQSYQKQMRRLTDAHRDRGARVPHSESKKPYLPDQGYQEMEYFDTPWDGPNFPGYPGFPDDPGINDDPEVDGFQGGNPPKDPHSEFLGCNFYISFSPAVVSAGELAVAKLERRDDPIVGFTVHGPGRVSTGGDPSGCTAANQRARSKRGLPPQPGSPECTVILKVDENIDYDKWGTQGNMLEIVVVARTLSGGSCSSSVFVLKCTDVEPMSWDTDLSGTTIIRNGSCAVAILGGRGPYKWSVSGTGFSMQTASTPIDGFTNVLLADGTACGVATITVKDNCGNTVTGPVRVPDYGEWVLISENTNCVYGGLSTSHHCPSFWGDHVREGIQYMCESQYGLSFGGGTVPDCNFCQAHCGASVCLSCAPCVVGRCGDCGFLAPGDMPCCNTPGGKLYCICEKGFQCWEWRCS
jgi:hypothetical protein